MKTVYIHIGLPKTGTSFLQTTFAFNADRYLLRGLSYPDLNNDRAAAAKGAATSGNAVPIAAPVVIALSRVRKGISPIDLLDRLDVDFDHLLSSEYLAVCPVEYLRNIVELISRKFEVKIIVFVRDPSDHIVSSYQQGLKKGIFPKPFRFYVDNLIERNRLFYKNIFALKDSIIVVNYDYCRNKMIERFDGITFGENFSQSPPYLTVNPSPDAHQTAILQIANALEITKTEEARKYIMHTSDREFPKNILPIDIYDRIFDELESEINGINRMLPENEIIKKCVFHSHTELSNLLDTQDIEFLSNLIKKKNQEKNRRDLSFIARWAHRTRLYSSNELPEGFSVTSYFAYNPDLVEARVNPIKHYILFGRKEGRRYK